MSALWLLVATSYEQRAVAGMVCLHAHAIPSGEGLEQHNHLMGLLVLCVDASAFEGKLSMSGSQTGGSV